MRKGSILPVLLFVLSSPILLLSQVPAAQLVTKPIDETKLVSFRGNVHPVAQGRYDRGLASDATIARRLLLILNRPPEREAALDQFLKDAHTPGTHSFHKWMTPQQFGERFGPADSDIQAVAGWLGSKGFQVTRISKGKASIEFSGTFGQVREAFHTEIHRYEINGQLHYANATDPQIPEALAEVTAGISALNDFHARPAMHVAGRAHLDRETHSILPDFTLTGAGGKFYAVGPEDFSTQYDLAPLYAAGVNGSGKTIGIINDSNIDLSLSNAYRGLFGLASNPPEVVLDGGDPGVNGDAIEAYLDVEAAGAVAPAATVKLYIAAEDTLDDILVLAMQRAVEDNEADVLSISFGNCEANLGTSNNQLINSIWKQAAAQGQTVFVSTGDNGSAGCDDPAPPRIAAIAGFAVNGFASTSWTVAVGGTDFYYSDYASGAPSAATLWNQSNDASNGSLKAPLPEQVWNDWFGLNARPSPLQTIYAGSGGKSSVYAKPAWQVGSGVPSDNGRDLPDVSLFAADGANLSGWAICANPGDCTPDQNGQISLVIVGGTSASSPAMAGIMALVDQKYGRQGQANFVLYPLAKQAPSAFHDITKGGNNVACVQNSPNCVLGTTGTDNGQYALSGYSAGAHYDLATGLGSIDANALVSNWNKISFVPTTTTLQLSSTNFTHGAAVSFTVNVSHRSGSAAPTGNISILTNSPLPFASTQGILSLGINGSASGSVDTLPGGTYEVWASYPGDATYFGGTSSPVQVTVAPEDSATSLAGTYQGITFGSGTSINDGQSFYMLAEPKGKTSSRMDATGSISFTLDNQPPISVPLNVQGVANWATPNLAAAGTHTVTASYSGDASFNPSQSAAFTYTVSKANSALYLGPGGICGTGVTCTAVAGDTVPIEVSLQLYGPQPPTGTVKVTMGSQTQTVATTTQGFYGEQVLTGIAKFSGLSAGTYPVSATYSGDNNFSSASNTSFFVVMTPSSGTRIPTTTVVTETSPVVQYHGDGVTQFTVTVTGGPGAGGPPTGTVVIYTNGLGESEATLTPSGPNSSTGTPPNLQLGDYFNIGSNQITAVYTGDSIYQESVSAPIALTDLAPVIDSDFLMAAAVPKMLVSKGGSANTSVTLNSILGFNDNVSLACATSSSALSCKVAPNAVALNGYASVALTVTSTASSTTQKKTRTELAWPFAGALACCFFLGLTGGARRQRWLALAMMSCLILCWMGCGGGSSSSPGPPIQQQQPPPTVTSYDVVVTGTAASGTVHNTTVTVIVQ